YRDDRFAARLEAQLSHWTSANPAGRGINWVSPREIGIRAANWIWALGTLEGWRPLSSPLRKDVAQSLAVHGRHICANLEETPLMRSNHYLGDILGLIAIGYALPGDREARGWF